MMKFYLRFLWVLLVSSNLPAQDLTLFSDKSSVYTIIIPESPTDMEVLAGKVLQDYIQRITSYTIPIKFDTIKESPFEILVGKVERTEKKNIPYDKLGKDGLLIKTVNSKLVLTGGDYKGVLYAVYTFLDKYLGCKKFSSSATFIPKKDNIVLDEIYDLQLPAFLYRETTYRDTRDKEYMNWHKLNGGEEKSWGLWVHTFEHLLDPREYGEDHPEYFSFYEGKRHPGAWASFDGKGFRAESQLCLSNPEVLEIVCSNLEKAIQRNPNAKYWSVSQNDNINYCRCDSCAYLDNKYAAYQPEERMVLVGGEPAYSTLGMGSLLTFINKVAERFPDKIISTLAYLYSRTPPKGIIPRENVNIMLCNIESSRNTPLTKGDNAFVEDLEGWSKLTNNILVWDYTIRFGNLLAPFPNLRVLQPNLQLFHNTGVSLLYQQANREIGGEFAELRAYLISKLMWDPNIDLEDTIKAFLDGFYGPASAEISEYINILHDNNQSENEVEMGIFGSPIDEKETFLSQYLIEKYDSLFVLALKKVKNEPVFYERVKSAKSSIDFAKLEIARAEKTGKRGMFTVEDDGKIYVKPEVSEMLIDFVYQCVRNNVTRISEWHTTPLEYLHNYSWYYNISPVPISSGKNKTDKYGIY